jgi:DNA-binding transcriptional LysR family regulator
MDRLKSLRLFAAIADAGSLSAAGRKLGMPLTTVSRRLASLEESLGTRLVTRTTRSLAITEPGKRFLTACRSILEQLESAEADLKGVQGEPAGVIAITAPIVFGRLHLLPVLAECLRAYPRLDARLDLADKSIDLIEEGIDVALRIGRLGDSSLMATRVGAVYEVVCASPAYIDAHGLPRTPEALAGHDCITFQNRTPRDRWTFRTAGKERRVAVRSRLSVSTAEAAVDAAVAGLGITRVLSYQAAAAVAKGQLRPLLERFQGSELPVSLIHHESRLPQVKVQAFVAFAAPRLRRSLQNLSAGPAKRTGR